MRIVLAGFMGTGKTVVGRRLAARLGVEFLDLDAWTEEEAGMPVAEIFAQRGEGVFRSLEKNAIKAACEREDIVIAAGGGAIVDDENRTALVRAGRVFCLIARPEVVASRVGRRAASRPMLAGHEDLVARIRELQAEREPAYSSIPDQVDTSDLSVDEVVDSIEHVLGADPASRGPKPC